MNSEKMRLKDDQEKKQHWRRWGPYLSERQWATVREDYSKSGDVWNYFVHDEARSRAYRWGEDGLGGISDNHQRLCFALALWNEKDPIIKERLFGLSNTEGNHGEDIKEYHFYIDNTPTHSYMHFLYKYPQAAFPYAQLVEENRKRGLNGPEYELIDTGIFAQNRYFDVSIEYAKASPDDLVILITVSNRSAENATLHVLPTLWFRNTWDWGKKEEKPSIRRNQNRLEAEKKDLGTQFLYFENPKEVLFTENETDFKRVFGTPNKSQYVKDGFHKYLVDKDKSAVNPQQVGTKSCLHYEFSVPANQSASIRLRLSSDGDLKSPFDAFEEILKKRKEEADQFYRDMFPPHITEDLSRIQRQAFAGMLWNKQFYHYVVEEWLNGDPGSPIERRIRRNADWTHLYNDDILSIPDSWEYPCFFSWDSAFHTIPFAMMDAEFAKKQLILLTREWYMHPNGQIPAYEWAFSDVNPPVHAWAAWRVYKIDEKNQGKPDHLFLERVFQKLLLNFTWWVNRKDVEGRNIFQGGFLGLDNISVFDRSTKIPDEANLYESDASSWMGMYCLNMLKIALELAQYDPSYEDMASKFFEHFLYIADAINYPAERKFSLWNEEDGFYYDMLQTDDGSSIAVKVHSLVGLIPLFAVDTISPELLNRFPGFRKRLEWFLENRGDLCDQISCLHAQGVSGRRLLSVINPDRLKRVLHKLLDENEFLSPHGIRSVSKYHQEHPYVLRINSNEYRLEYEPGTSSTKLFGGNSNWRGPVWFPINMLIIESLQKFHYYFGDDFKVECPTGSGKWMNLWEVSHEIASRLSRLFMRDEQGRRPIFGDQDLFQNDPYWKDFLIFPEYFHGDNGLGLGSSHQTGWTGLIAKLIQQLCEYDTPVPSKCF
ncbi:MAG TPA: glucosidase [Rhabdochlamydiaceae bacterium]|nr:glucosidase [Rhabdochlamydiaceae bacterium]